MRISVKIIFFITLHSIPLHTGWLLPDGIDEAGKKIAELAEAIKKEGLTIKSDPETIRTLHEFNINLDAFNKSFQNSALTTENLNKFRLSCAYTFVGLCFSACGVKLLYDACRDVQAKLNDPENKERPWHEILEWSDGITPLIGIVNLGIGYKIISES